METGCRPVTCGAAEGWPLDLPVNGSPLADGKKQMIVSFTVKQTIMYSTIINYTLSDAELSWSSKRIPFGTVICRLAMENQHFNN